MLRELRLKDFAIVASAAVEFGPGLTCLTGETGAGKSILVDALGLALGGRADAGMVGPGGTATVEALFDVAGVPGVSEELDSIGVDTDGGELIVRRVVGSNGRSKAYLNGSMVNASTLQSIGGLLVDIHGQHEHQSLLRVDTHLDLLDMHLGLGGLKAEYAEAFEKRRELKARLDDIVSRARERAQRLDLIRYQADEIDQAGLSPGEDDELEEERVRLANFDRLAGLAHEAAQALRDAEPSALSMAVSALGSVKDIAGLVEGQAETVRFLESATIAMEEASAGIRDFAAGLESDPRRLEEVEDRLDLVKGLKKKYGDTIADILDYRTRIGVELEGLEYADEEADSLRERLAGAEEALAELAGRLGEARRDGAAGFCREVKKELSSLGMPKAAFEVGFDVLEEPGLSGAERAEFLFSANPGVGPRPLAKVASGGELSRVMLALKVVLSREDGVPTLVFDEVDSGIGGRTATVVGEKLRAAARNRQVLCITHLPQVASCASEHVSVTKRTVGGGVAVELARLDTEGRVGELARMLGGDDLKTASAHARELVKQGTADG